MFAECLGHPLPLCCSETEPFEEHCLVLSVAVCIRKGGNRPPWPEEPQRAHSLAVSQNLTNIVTQLLEEAGVIFPGQPKRLHISQPETCYRIAYSVVIYLFKIGFHHGEVRPRH